MIESRLHRALARSHARSTVRYVNGTEHNNTGDAVFFPLQYVPKIRRQDAVWYPGCDY
jgi:hypothetical protein